MQNIAIMDMALANTIAAGEVVDRPASVIKELVENAIDAKAKSIIIEVNNMGLDSIIVTDDGLGMDKADLYLAYQRHATSKIFSIKDLTQIVTMGFRGEALPSIASVSKLEIHSRTKDNEGYYVKIQDSKLIDEGKTTLNRGTKVKVFELFYNTPARFKYMKSEYAEKHAIIDIFEKLTLSFPSISFTLIMDQKEVRKTLGNDSVQALIETIYGKETTNGMKTLSTSIGKVKVDAYLIDPKFVRSKRSDVVVFINHRYVRNYAISQSVIEGYQTFLMTNKYPISLIYLSIDPSLIDVNVHPQKMEVKLANEVFISFALTPLVKKTLESGNLPIRESITHVKKDFFKPEVINLFDLVKSEDYLNEPETIKTIIEEEKSSDKLPDFDYIGTLFGTYLLFQNSNGLFLMDQHAAAERIRYEYYVNQVGNLLPTVYELLIPRPLLITTKDFDYLKSFDLVLGNLGFRFIDDKLIAHPSWLRDEEIDIAVESICNQLQEAGSIDLKKLRNQLAKDISCKGAIKANHQLSLLEIDHLVKDLKQCLNPYTCPHGRPVVIKVSNYDIERMFKRIV